MQTLFQQAHAQQKTAHASEQDRPDIVRRREAWFEGQLDLDPARLVVIDETWASTTMARRYGRAPRGQRLRAGIPHGHGKTSPFVAGFRTTALVAPFVLDGPINRAAFETSVAKGLGPELRRGDVVVMDNLSSHKGPRMRKMIEAADASLLYLPPDSPEPKDRVSDFHPIETAFAKWKAVLRKAAERTRGPLDCDRRRPRNLHARRMRQLLRCSRIRCNVSGSRSKQP